jgi:hypothetical protein
MRLQDIRYAVVALALLVAPACGRVGDNTSAVNQRDTAATAACRTPGNDAPRHNEGYRCLQAR